MLTLALDLLSFRNFEESAWPIHICPLVTEFLRTSIQDRKTKSFRSGANSGSSGEQQSILSLERSIYAN